MLNPLTTFSSWTIAAPFKHASTSLDSAGVAGLFGGDEATAAMATVHVYEGKAWLGFYNSPGSYQVARKFGQLARSKFRDTSSAGFNVDPATLLGVEGKKGPKYIAAKSGTVIQQTGHCAYLFTKECEKREPVILDGRETTRVSVTIADLRHIPNYHITPTMARPYATLLACIPIAASIGTSAASAAVGDWCSSSMILLGMLISGLSCQVLGSGELTFTHPKPALGSPGGDGWLRGDKEIVILRGAEAAVNSITRGSFALHFRSEHEYRRIGICALLLIGQFVAQLLVIPQGTLFGQIMFITSLAISWIYNSYLSSLDKETIQRNILRKGVLQDPLITKYSLGTWTTAVVFVLLATRPDNVEKKLNKFLPNDTAVWMRWKETVLASISSGSLRFDEADFAAEGFAGDERTLLMKLYGDAKAAYDGYNQHLAAEPLRRLISSARADTKISH